MGRILHRLRRTILSMDITEWFSQRPLFICFAFGALSTLATLHNKFIFTHVMDSSNTLLLVQNVVTLLFLTICSRLKLISFSVHFSSHADWLAGIVYALSVVTGLWSLMYVSVVMFGVLKRSTSFVSWGIEFLLTPGPSTMKCLPPLILMLIGSIVATVYDFKFSVVGYALAGASCIFQGSAYELGRRVARRNHGVCAVLHSNSVAAIPILAIILVFTGDIKEVRKFTDPRIAMHLVFNSFTCLSMNYFIFLNCFVNSPLAHSVTGNMKVVVTTVLGAVLFATPMSPLGFAGLLLTFLGGFWFSYVKLVCSGHMDTISSLLKTILPSGARSGSGSSSSGTSSTSPQPVSRYHHHGAHSSSYHHHSETCAVNVSHNAPPPMSPMVTTISSLSRTAASNAPTQPAFPPPPPTFSAQSSYRQHIHTPDHTTDAPTRSGAVAEKDE